MVVLSLGETAVFSALVDFLTAELEGNLGLFLKNSNLFANFFRHQGQ